MYENVSGVNACTCSYLDTTNPRVGNWQGPYEIGPLASFNWGKRFWRARVCILVNAAPNRKSRIMRASTASAWDWSSSTGRWAALWICLWDRFRNLFHTQDRRGTYWEIMALNLALFTRIRGLAFLHTWATSDPICSPSLSQSVHIISVCAPLASEDKFWAIDFPSLLIRDSITASKRVKGSQECHDLCSAVKSCSVRCPETEVTVNSSLVRGYEKSKFLMNLLEVERCKNSGCVSTTKYAGIKASYSIEVATWKDLGDRSSDRWLLRDTKHSHYRIHRTYPLRGSFVHRLSVVASRLRLIRRNASRRVFTCSTNRPSARDLLLREFDSRHHVKL